MRFTLLGANGFIGRHLTRHLRGQGYDVRCFSRDELPTAAECLGHVIYGIGLTGNFRQRPLETIEAHSALHARLLYRSRFQSWLYLSSTRVYGGGDMECAATEDEALRIVPSADSLYDLTKVLGEATCLGHSAPGVRVARLSNVFGPGQSSDTFLGAVLRAVRTTGRATIEEAPQSSKDYVSVDDVVELLVAIALRGHQRVYNVASGQPTTHEQLADRLRQLTGAHITFASGGPLRIFPTIDTSRVHSEFPYMPRQLLCELERMVAANTTSEGIIS